MAQIKTYTSESADFERARLKHLKKEVLKLDLKKETINEVSNAIDEEIEFFNKLIKDSNGN